jgi:hypothetical protein
VEESWAQGALQWLITPALITGFLVALAQFYDPPTRWSRRLKGDLAILGGLPEGKERERWQESVEWQALRLRQYRTAFVGGTLLMKWGTVTFLGVAIFGLVLWPPFGDGWGPTDWILIGLGVVNSLLIGTFISAGYDLGGRSPVDIMRARRVRAHDRRLKKLRRIERVRAERAKTDSSIRPIGSRLGFSTQADEFGAWVRDPGLRTLARLSGVMGADLRQDVRGELRARGVAIPPDPDW